jgi:hypothetical protein
MPSRRGRHDRQRQRGNSGDYCVPLLPHRAPPFEPTLFAGGREASERSGRQSEQRDALPSEERRADPGAHVSAAPRVE